MTIIFPLSAISSKYRIEYKDEIMKVDYSNFEGVEVLISTSNGKEYKRKSFIFGFMDEEEALPVQLVYLIETTYNFVRRNNYFGLPFLAVPLIGLGVASLMYTEKMWKLQYIFTVKGGEPTEWAIFIIRLGGILSIGIGCSCHFWISKHLGGFYEYKTNKTMGRLSWIRAVCFFRLRS